MAFCFAFFVLAGGRPAGPIVHRQPVVAGFLVSREGREGGEVRSPFQTRRSRREETHFNFRFPLSAFQLAPRYLGSDRN